MIKRLSKIKRDHCPERGRDMFRMQYHIGMRMHILYIMDVDMLRDMLRMQHHMSMHMYITYIMSCSATCSACTYTTTGAHVYALPCG